MGYPLNLNRSQLLKIVGGDEDALRKLEMVFGTVAEIAPKVTEETAITAGTADAKAQEALDAVDALSSAMYGPPTSDDPPDTPFSPPVVDDPQDPVWVPPQETSLSDMADAFILNLANYELLQYDDTIGRFRNVGNLAGVRYGVDSTNYSFFEDDGTLVFNGDATVWKDLVFPIIPKFVGPGNPAFNAFVGGITAPQFAVNDAVQLDASELAHEWKEGTDIYLHLHYTSMTNVAATRGVKWEIGITYVDTSDGTSQWAAESVVSVEHTIPANTPALTEFIVPMGAVSIPNGKIGGQIRIRAKRIAAVGTAPATDPFLTQVGVHIECDTTGSREISSK